MSSDTAADALPCRDQATVGREYVPIGQGKHTGQTRISLSGQHPVARVAAVLSFSSFRAFAMFTIAAADLLANSRQLALPLPLFMLLAGPAAHAQAPTPLADLSVYPNPAHIRATVQVPAVPEATRATVTLTDAQGKVVFEQPVSLTAAGGTAQVPLLGRTPGIYRVQVQAGEQRVARTLTVE